MEFPKEIAIIIADYATRPMLLSWIDESKLDQIALCRNPLAIEAGLIDLEAADPKNISSNPVAADYIMANYKPADLDPSCWRNPGLYEWLLDNHGLHTNDHKGIVMRLKKIGGFAIIDHLSRNIHPAAVKLMIKGYNHNDQSIRPSAANPAATDWIKKNPTAYGAYNYDWDLITDAYENPGMIGMLTNFRGRGHWISGNSHPSVIRALQKSPHVIDWEAFSANPGIFEYRRDQKVVAILTAAAE